MPSLSAGLIMGKKKKEKKKKEKITYVDDNSTVVDMNVEGHRWYNKNKQPKKESTFKEKWNTYISTVKLMLVPLAITLGIMLVIYLIVLLLAKL